MTRYVQIWLASARYSVVRTLMFRFDFFQVAVRFRGLAQQPGALFLQGLSSRLERFEPRKFLKRRIL